MRIESTKWLRFCETSWCWWVENRQSGASLGRIEYYYPWRQWVFSTENADAVFNAECLDSISAMCRRLTAERKETLKARRTQNDV